MTGMVTVRVAHSTICSVNLMDTTDGIDYVRANDRAVLATARGDGTPQMSPVTLAVVDETIVLSTRETAFKVTNL